MKLAYYYFPAVAVFDAFQCAAAEGDVEETEDVAWAYEDTESWDAFYEPFFDPEDHDVTYPDSLLNSSRTFLEYNGCEELNCEMGEFCGKDLLCHPYNCINWYTLAHPNYTRYRPGISEELECKPVPEDGKDRSYLRAGTVFCGRQDGYFPNAVYYNPWEKNASVWPDGFPDGFAGFRPCRETEDVLEELAAIKFNRKCTAIPQQGFGFACYDMDPAINLDDEINTYLQHVSHLNGQEDESVLAESDAINPNEDSPSGHHSYFLTLKTLNIYSGDPRGSPTGFSEDDLRKTILADVFSEPRGGFKTGAFPICPEGCAFLQFCGTDMTCHSYNCENIYRYAPRRYSGNRSTRTKSLVCSTDLPKEDSPCEDGGWPIAIRYLPPTELWRTNFCRRDPDDFEAEPLKYSRRCHAKGFECYDMSTDDIGQLSRTLEDFRNKSLSHEYDKEKSAVGWVPPRFVYETNLRIVGLLRDSRHTSAWQYELDMDRVQSLVRSTYSAATSPYETATFFMVILCWVVGSVVWLS